MPELTFKDNVTVCFSVNNQAILEKAKRVFFQLGYDCHVTGGLEGNHSQKSFHYRNAALDFGVKHIPADQRETVKKALCGEFGCRYPGGIGPNYDVLHEAQGTDNEHIHIEEDVKARRGL